MDMKKEKITRKKYSKKEKLLILSEASKKGVKVTLEKYNLYPATYYYWKKNLSVSSETHRLELKESRIRIKALEQENQALKLLLAETQLASKLQGELLKKKYQNQKK